MGRDLDTQRPCLSSYRLLPPRSSTFNSVLVVSLHPEPSVELPQPATRAESDNSKIFLVVVGRTCTRTHVRMGRDLDTQRPCLSSYRLLPPRSSTFNSVLVKRRRRWRRSPSRTLGRAAATRHSRRVRQLEDLPCRSDLDRGDGQDPPEEKEETQQRRAQHPRHHTWSRTRRVRQLEDLPCRRRPHLHPHRPRRTRLVRLQVWCRGCWRVRDGLRRQRRRLFARTRRRFRRHVRMGRDLDTQVYRLGKKAKGETGRAVAKSETTRTELKVDERGGKSSTEGSGWASAPTSSSFCSDSSPVPTTRPDGPRSRHIRGEEEKSRVYRLGKKAKGETGRAVAKSETTRTVVVFLLGLVAGSDDTSGWAEI
jgi:hypothetical protein